MNDTSVNTRGKLKSPRAVALLGGAGALALALGGVTLATASSASADTVTTIPGNPTCKALIPGSEELKFDNDPAPGSGEKAGVTVTWTQAGDLIDFTATGGTVLGAIVKGGPNGTFYDYRPAGTTSGSGLHTPVNDNNGKYYGLSHLSFCVGHVTTSTPPPTTDTPSPTTDTPPPTTDTPPPTTDTPPPTTDTPPPTTDTPPPTTDTPPPTSDTPPPTKDTPPPATATPVPTDTPSETPAVSPTSTTSSTPVGVPTEVDAGLSGGMKNASATTSSQGIWGIALLTLGGVLVFFGVLKARQRRGQHSA